MMMYLRYVCCDYSVAQNVDEEAAKVKLVFDVEVDSAVVLAAFVTEMEGAAVKGPFRLTASCA